MLVITCLCGADGGADECRGSSSSAVWFAVANFERGGGGGRLTSKGSGLSCWQVGSSSSSSSTAEPVVSNSHRWSSSSGQRVVPRALRGRYPR